MSDYPTHASIDMAIHSIERIQLFENSAHTHRVFFNCGLRFDVRGEHQFADHVVGTPIKATPSETALLKLSRSARDAVEREEIALSELSARDPGAREDEAEADRWRSLLLAQEEKLDQARKKLARTNENYHLSRERGVCHDRWLTSSATKSIKTTCPECIGIEAARVKMLGTLERE